jgi:hypothetical protein
VTFDDPLFALRVLYVGKPGSGKSFRMLADLAPLPRVVLFDTQGRYVRPFPFEKELRVLLAPFDIVEARQLEGYLRARLTKSFSALVYAVADRERAFEAVCRLVTGAKEIAFGVDEARLVCSPTYIGPQFSRVVNWRGDCVRLFANSQRPAHLHTDLRAAATDWFVFTTTGQHDLASMDACGVPVHEAGAAVLPRRAFLHYRDTGDWYLDKTAVSGGNS